MTGKGHFATGVFCAPIAFHLTQQYGGYGILGAAGLILGANAPDYLELWTKKYDRDGRFIASIPKIKHRTITHILSLWLILFCLSFANMPHFENSENFSSFIQFFNLNDYIATLPYQEHYFNIIISFLFGWTAGGLLHLLTDIPNPMGIPIFFKKRYSLNLWKSGKNESFILVAFLLANLFYFDLIKINQDTISQIKGFFV